MSNATTKVFIDLIIQELQRAGWRLMGSNELWPLFHRFVDGRQETLPLPTALACEITYDCTLCPLVEEYLKICGWLRAHAVTSGGGPKFSNRYLFNDSNRNYKPLTLAIIQQLSVDKQNELRGDSNALTLVRRRACY